MTGQDESLRAEHRAMEEAFAGRCAELGLKLDPVLFWYHTLDLGESLITPGSFDYRSAISEYGLPQSMAGMQALDVGSATGFFSFEMERRGADVTSVELPSLLSWDRFPGVSTEQIITTIRGRLPYHTLQDFDEFIQTASHAAIYIALIDGPFQFCRSVLASRITRRYAEIYDLPRLFGSSRRFDVVMLGDILLHLIDPLRALASAASICAGTLVIAQTISHEGTPLMRWIATPDDDTAEWWQPSLGWFRAILQRLGFRSVDVVGQFHGRIRPGGESFNKTVIHARRD